MNQIVDDFHPRTGAYWQGWLDALDGNEAEPPEHYGEDARADYYAGYEAADTDSDDLRRNPAFDA